jgi:cell division protein FtsB
MSEYVQVEQDSSLYKNTETGAVINVDDQAYTNYMKMKQRKDKKNREIDQLKDEISELKGMLKTLLDNNK